MVIEGLDTTDMASLAAAKQQLRLLMKQRLASVSSESVLTQSKAILNSLSSWPPYMNAQRLSVFLSMPSGEVQTDAIVRHALASGKKVYVPYLHKSPLLDGQPHSPARVMDMVRLRDLADYESLAPDRWGIPSIDPATVHERQRILGGPDVQHSDSPSDGLDLILLPGVAFDVDPESGLVRRCGHGKGFYDFFLHRYASKIAKGAKKDSSSVLLFGLALTEQFLTPTPSSPPFSDVPGGPVPSGPLDRRLDGLILGNGDIKSSVEVDSI